ncbi:hypothetical protein APR12_005606 [Nocardia amikacinitolerans]|nr:hypothetical protein [Nocardia amikacinitolerans]
MRWTHRSHPLRSDRLLVVVDGAKAGLLAMAVIREWVWAC